jgi:hypothetical protein
MPIYRIEVTSRPGDAFWDILLGFTEEDWITLDLASGGSFPVDVYDGILAAAVEAFLLSVRRTSAAESAALSEEFNVDLWPDAAEADIDQVLAGSGALTPSSPTTSAKARRSDSWIAARTHGFSSISAVAPTATRRHGRTRCGSAGARRRQ